MSKNKKNLELPKDYVWKVLGKLAKLADEYAYTDYSRRCVDRIISIIRSRNFNSYIAFCKSAVSLRAINHFYPYSYIVGERTLREIRALRLLTIFQKYPFIESDFDRDGAAFKDFIEAESRCRHFNDSTTLFNREDSESAFSDLFVFPLIKKIKRVIRRVCGKLKLSQIIDQRHNGPGATVDCRGDRAIECFKNIFPISTNQSCFSLFGPHIPVDSNLALYLFGENVGCRSRSHGSYPTVFYSVDNSGASLNFVPKSAETSRTICIEPTLNVALQLGLDRILRSRMKRVLRIDLNTQENNQELARIGSIQRNLVTVDLKAASDSISLKLLNLLPVEWAEVIFRLRSHRWNHELHGNSEFHKVSAMGNGATFVLESLLFASVCRVVYALNNIPWNESTVAIHGDDLVIRKEAYIQTRLLLKHLGFIANSEKTFADGPVRESCGHDYYNGHRIDRFTCKNDLSKPIANTVLYNSLFLFFKEYDFRSETCEELLLLIRKYLPKNFENFGPCTPDDKGSWLFCEESAKIPFWHDGYQDWYIRLKRNEKYHPSETVPVTKRVMALPAFSDGELPFYPWKSVQYRIPIGNENSWQPATFFSSRAAQSIGCTTLGSFTDIGDKTDVYTSIYLKKGIDVVRQTTILKAARLWGVGTTK